MQAARNATLQSPVSTFSLQECVCKPLWKLSSAWPRRSTRRCRCTSRCCRCSSSASAAWPRCTGSAWCGAAGSPSPAGLCGPRAPRPAPAPRGPTATRCSGCRNHRISCGRSCAGTEPGVNPQPGTAAAGGETGDGIPSFHSDNYLFSAVFFYLCFSKSLLQPPVFK